MLRNDLINRGLINLLSCAFHEKLRDISIKHKDIFLKSYGNDKNDYEIISKLLTVLSKCPPTNLPTFINRLEIELSSGDYSLFVVGELRDWLPFNPENSGYRNEQTAINEVLNSIKNLWVENRVKEIELKNKSITEKIEDIKDIDIESEFDLEPSTTDVSIYLKDLDIDSIKEVYGKGLESSFPLINENTTSKGYTINSLNLIAAPTGAGKTTFMLNEMVHFATNGIKCYYTVLGDMNRYDIITRIMAIYFKEPIFNVTKNTKKYFDEWKLTECGKNIMVGFFDAHSKSSEDLLRMFRNKKFIDEFQVYFIDYDSNLDKPGGDNLYTSYEKVYQYFLELKNVNKNVVFVAVQSSRASMAVGQKSIKIDQIGESLRKQQHTDLLIGIGRYSPDPVVNQAGSESFLDINQIGSIDILKNRRGFLSRTCYFRDIDLIFKQIDNELFTRILQSDSPVMLRNGVLERYSKLSLIES